MKLNERDFSEVLSFIFEINLVNFINKWILNSVPHRKQEKILSDLHMPRLISIYFIFLWSLLQWKWEMPVTKVIGNVSILWTKKNNVRFEYVLRRNVWFCFISIVWVHCSHRTKKFWFWKSLRYFNIFWLKKWCQIWLFRNFSRKLRNKL